MLCFPTFPAMNSLKLFSSLPSSSISIQSLPETSNTPNEIMGKTFSSFSLSLLHPFFTLTLTRPKISNLKQSSANLNLSKPKISVFPSKLRVILFSEDEESTTLCHLNLSFPALKSRPVPILVCAPFIRSATATQRSQSSSAAFIVPGWVWLPDIFNFSIAFSLSCLSSGSSYKVCHWSLDV